mmetsp:Transcript_37349/g.81906  ORF Transcript_37349/g.81906 Transcript_37349/m.81906 type:complete len:94 (+) Transcript_37349:242-523(+)
MGARKCCCQEEGSSEVLVLMVPGPEAGVGGVDCLPGPLPSSSVGRKEDGEARDQKEDMRACILTSHLFSRVKNERLMKSPKQHELYKAKRRQQ